MAQTGGQSERPQRICVIGCGGTGKSTLARLLGERLGLPVHHLDVMFWRAGWQPGTNAKLTADLEPVVNSERWIIDGNFAATLPMRVARADAVVWLDLPTHEALWGALRRAAHYRGRSRPDMAQGCVESFDWSFLRWVLEFREKSRPQIESALRDVGGRARVIQVTRRREIAAAADLLTS